MRSSPYTTEQLAAFDRMDRIAQATRLKSKAFAALIGMSVANYKNRLRRQAPWKAAEITRAASRLDQHLNNIVREMCR